VHEGPPRPSSQLRRRPRWGGVKTCWARGGGRGGTRFTLGTAVGRGESPRKRVGRAKCTSRSSRTEVSLPPGRGPRGKSPQLVAAAYGVGSSCGRTAPQFTCSTGAVPIVAEVPRGGGRATSAGHDGSRTSVGRRSSATGTCPSTRADPGAGPGRLPRALLDPGRLRRRGAGTASHDLVNGLQGCAAGRRVARTARWVRCRRRGRWISEGSIQALLRRGGRCARRTTRVRAADGPLDSSRHRGRVVAGCGRRSPPAGVGCCTVVTDTDGNSASVRGGGASKGRDRGRREGRAWSAGATSKTGTGKKGKRRTGEGGKREDVPRHFSPVWVSVSDRVR